MKFISIDIETTGLDPETHELIEIGAVAADTNDPFKWDTFRAVIIHEHMVVDPFCAMMHKELWQEILDHRKHIAPFSDDPIARKVYNDQNDTLYLAPCALDQYFKKWLMDIGYDGAINVAGKNYGTFDKLFLDKLWKVKTRHRILDPSVMYWDPTTDDALPNMQTCCERAGLELENFHTAVGDAITVAKLIMRKINGSAEESEQN